MLDKRELMLLMLEDSLRSYEIDPYELDQLILAILNLFSALFNKWKERARSKEREVKSFTRWDS